MNKRSAGNLLANSLLRAMAFSYNHRPKLRKYLKSTHGWINLLMGFRTENCSVNQAIHFNDGEVRVLGKIPPEVDITLIFRDDEAMKEMLKSPPNEVLNMLLRNKLRTEGNLAYLSLFNFFSALLLRKKHRKMIEKQCVLLR